MYSINFLFPVSISDSEIHEIFEPDLIGKLDNVYSFGNLKNHVSYYDINNQIRCFVWKFNEYTNLPEIEKQDKMDSISIRNFVDNSFGKNPTLTVFNKQFESFARHPKLILDNHSENIYSTETDKKIDLFGKISSIGLFNERDIYEVKFQFDQPTLARLNIFKLNDDFYITLFYGINGYEINKHENILKVNNHAQRTWL